MAKKIFDITGILSIIAGIVILIWPNILSFAVGIYLIIIGILSFWK